MARIVFTTSVFFFIIIMLTGVFSYADGLSLGVQYGAQTLLSEGNKYWDMGSSYRVFALYQVHTNILVGGQVGYNKSSPDVNHIKKDFRLNYYGEGVDKNLIHWDITGKMECIEILPSVRIVSSPSVTGRSNYFGQLGLGLYMLDFEATDTDAGTEKDLISKSENRFGFNLGGGVVLWSMGNADIEILTLYHYIFTKDEGTQYFSLNLGVGFEI